MNENEAKILESIEERWNLIAEGEEAAFDRSIFKRTNVISAAVIEYTCGHTRCEHLDVIGLCDYLLQVERMERHACPVCEEKKRRERLGVKWADSAMANLPAMTVDEWITESGMIEPAEIADLILWAEWARARLIRGAISPASQRLNDILAKGEMNDDGEKAVKQVLDILDAIPEVNDAFAWRQLYVGPRPYSESEGMIPEPDDDWEDGGRLIRLLEKHMENRERHCRYELFDRAMEIACKHRACWPAGQKMR